MPCVLPILSLKALYLATHKEKSSTASALMYLSGVLSSFIILSGILFYLKNLGIQLGWGFQLQSPIFNIFLFILFFFIFLSLIDKLPFPSAWTDRLNRISSNQSYLTGFFAVLIACPCTGPFMGAALGYALWQPPHIYFSIFIALGLGYALPYTIIEICPNLCLKYIPKPGAWMITLKRILSLPIALTCLWLGWITYNQLIPQRNTDLTWEEYDNTAINEALAKNEPVFIDFTAKWCLICLLNDKTVLSSLSFKKLIKEHHIRIFKADWTNRDDKIKASLNTYNRNSVPLYVYYPTKSRTPKILPQILTEKIITETIAAH
jgi:thiol:disulfide interchange protein DsbD